MTESVTEVIALVGATGAIGKSVAAALREQGRRYRLIGRSLPSLEKTFGGDPLAVLVVWDPDNEASIRRALKGAAAIVYMVGVPYTDFRLHPILMRRVLDAAIAENVDRLLLIGTLYVFGLPQTERIDVGPVVVKMLDTPVAFGRVWNLGRAGATTQLELMRMAFGGPPRYMAAGKMMLRAMGLFDPFLKEFVEMHYLMTDPLIVDDSALAQILGGIKKTPYNEGVRQSLAAVG
jgi:nucleoside-diphosphate-sugar epimerase